MRVGGSGRLVVRGAVEEAVIREELAGQPKTSAAMMRPAQAESIVKTFSLVPYLAGYCCSLEESCSFSLFLLF